MVFTIHVSMIDRKSVENTMHKIQQKTLTQIFTETIPNVLEYNDYLVIFCTEKWSKTKETALLSWDACLFWNYLQEPTRFY